MNAAHPIPHSPISEGYSLSRHALKRMRLRGLPPEAIRAALWFGRVLHLRNADFYIIGHQEIRRQAREGVDLTAYEGVHVVCSPEGHIVTVYRNRDLSHIRPRAHHVRPRTRKFRSRWHRRGSR